MSSAIGSRAGTTAEEMTELLGPVNAECCDGPGEDCSSGYPSVCNAGCKTVLQPFRENCAGMLTSSPAWAPVRTLIDAAWATCPTTCDDDASFNEYIGGLEAACCPDAFAVLGHCDHTPTSCDATCAAVLFPLRQECFTYLDRHPDVRSTIESVARMCPGGTGLGADPCDPNPCFNHGECVARAPQGGGHRRAQAASHFTCNCPAGFIGHSCEMSTNTPTHETEGGCDPHLPSLVSTFIHILDPGMWKRMFAAAASLADELHGVDWSITATVGVCNGEEVSCGDQFTEADCITHVDQCFWADTSCMSIADPEDSYATFCVGETTFQPQEVIGPAESLEINEGLLTVRDAFGVLAEQLPDSDASVHLPPAVLDLDTWILETFEGDWHTVFDNLATFMHIFSHVDWAQVYATVTQQPCGIDCDEWRYSFDFTSRFARKIADAIPHHAPATPEATDNWCKISMLDIPQMLIANFDISSAKQTVQVIHDVAAAASVIDWEYLYTDGSGTPVPGLPVIDSETSQAMQDSLAAVSAAAGSVLQDMADVEARAPSSRTIGDVWDWLIDFIGSDWSGLGGSCEDLMSSLLQVDWAAVARDMNPELTDDDAQDFAADTMMTLGVYEGFCNKLVLEWPPQPPPASVCKTWMISFQDFMFENFNPPEVRKLLVDLSSALTSAATVDWSFSSQVNGCMNDPVAVERIRQIVSDAVGQKFFELSLLGSAQEDPYFQANWCEWQVGMDVWDNPCSAAAGFQPCNAPDESPTCQSCFNACVAEATQSVVDYCGDWDLSLAGALDGLLDPSGYGGVSFGRCCESEVPHYTQIITPEDSRSMTQAMQAGATALSRIVSTLPRRNDEDPNSSPWDIDGWLDDFLVADWEHIASQASLYFTAWSSVNLNLARFYGIDESDDSLLDNRVGQLQYLQYADVAELFASIPRIHAAKAPPSQACPNLMPALEGILASGFSPKRTKDIMDGCGALLTKVMNIDWSGTGQTTVCTSPRPNFAPATGDSVAGCSSRTEESCDYATVVPNLSPCPSAFVNDGICDEPPPPPVGLHSFIDVGLCASGTDTNDCQYGDYGSHGDGSVGSCYWIRQPGGQGTCAWNPDKGCVRWEQVPLEIAGPEVRV